MSVADLAIVAALVFGWGTLSARLERFDVTAPITFVLAGLLLTHGPLAVLGVTPSNRNPVVPARIRPLINVESGLNDGIATPFVSVALAGAATGGHAAGHGPAAAVAELAVGVLVGVAAGGAGGLLVNAARRRGWAAEGFGGSAVLGPSRRRRYRGPAARHARSQADPPCHPEAFGVISRDSSRILRWPSAATARPGARYSSSFSTSRFSRLSRSPGCRCSGPSGDGLPAGLPGR